MRPILQGDFYHSQYFFTEELVAGDGDCGFTALGVSSREFFVQSLLSVSHEENSRRKLRLEILAEFRSDDRDSLSPPEALREDWELLLNRELITRSEFNEARQAALLYYRSTNLELFESLRHANDQNLVSHCAADDDYPDSDYVVEKFNAHETIQEQMEDFCSREDIYIYYVNKYLPENNNGEKLWLGFDAALLFAEISNFSLCIWRKNRGSQKLESVNSHVADDQTAPLFHIVHTERRNHFNLLVYAQKPEEFATDAAERDWENFELVKNQETKLKPKTTHIRSDYQTPNDSDNDPFEGMFSHHSKLGVDYDNKQLYDLYKQGPVMHKLTKKANDVRYLWPILNSLVYLADLGLEYYPFAFALLLTLGFYEFEVFEAIANWWLDTNHNIVPAEDIIRVSNRAAFVFAPIFLLTLKIAREPYLEARGPRIPNHKKFDYFFENLPATNIYNCKAWVNPVTEEELIYFYKKMTSFLLSLGDQGFWDVVGSLIKQILNRYPNLPEATTIYEVEEETQIFDEDFSEEPEEWDRRKAMLKKLRAEHLNDTGRAQIDYWILGTIINESKQQAKSDEEFIIPAQGNIRREGDIFRLPLDTGDENLYVEGALIRRIPGLSHYDTETINNARLYRGEHKSLVDEPKITRNNIALRIIEAVGEMWRAPTDLKTRKNYSQQGLPRETSAYNARRRIFTTRPLVSLLNEILEDPFTEKLKPVGVIQTQKKTKTVRNSVIKTASAQNRSFLQSAHDQHNRQLFGSSIDPTETTPLTQSQSLNGDIEVVLVGDDEDDDSELLGNMSGQANLEEEILEEPIEIAPQKYTFDSAKLDRLAVMLVCLLRPASQAREIEDEGKSYWASPEHFIWSDSQLLKVFFDLEPEMQVRLIATLLASRIPSARLLAQSIMHDPRIPRSSSYTKKLANYIKFYIETLQNKNVHEEVINQHLFWITQVHGTQNYPSVMKSIFKNHPDLAVTIICRLLSSKSHQDVYAEQVQELFFYNNLSAKEKKKILDKLVRANRHEVIQKLGCVDRQRLQFGIIFQARDEFLELQDLLRGGNNDDRRTAMRLMASTLTDDSGLEYANSFGKFFKHHVEEFINNNWLGIFRDQILDVLPTEEQRKLAKGRLAFVMMRSMLLTKLKTRREKANIIDTVLRTFYTPPHDPVDYIATFVEIGMQLARLPSRAEFQRQMKHMQSLFTTCLHNNLELRAAKTTPQLLLLQLMNEYKSPNYNLTHRILSCLVDALIDFSFGKCADIYNCKDNLLDLFFNKTNIATYAHILIAGVKVPDPRDCKQGFYFYHVSDRVKVLVVHDADDYETLDLSDLVSEEELSKITWPADFDIAEPTTNEIMKVIVANCGRTRMQRDVLVALNRIISLTPDQEKFKYQSMIAPILLGSLNPFIEGRIQDTEVILRNSGCHFYELWMNVAAMTIGTDVLWYIKIIKTLFKEHRTKFPDNLNQLAFKNFMALSSLSGGLGGATFIDVSAILFAQLFAKHDLKDFRVIIKPFTQALHRLRPKNSRENIYESFFTDMINLDKNYGERVLRFAATLIYSNFLFIDDAERPVGYKHKLRKDRTPRFFKKPTQLQSRVVALDIMNILDGLYTALKGHVKLPNANKNPAFYKSYGHGNFNPIYNTSSIPLVPINESVVLEAIDDLFSEDGIIAGQFQALGFKLQHLPKILAFLKKDETREVTVKEEDVKELEEHRERWATMTSGFNMRTL